MTRNCTGGFRRPFPIKYPRVSGRATVQACLAGGAQSVWICNTHGLAPCSSRAYIDLSALAWRDGSGSYSQVDARCAEPRMRSHAGPRCSHDREPFMARSTAAGPADRRRASMAHPPRRNAPV